VNFGLRGGSVHNFSQLDICADFSLPLILSRYFKSVVQWSEFLVTDAEVWVQLPALPHFLRSGESGTGSTQPREYN
jgi:hypothetical protein